MAKRSMPEVLRRVAEWCDSYESFADDPEGEEFDEFQEDLRIGKAWLITQASKMERAAAELAVARGISREAGVSVAVARKAYRDHVARKAGA